MSIARKIKTHGIRASLRIGRVLIVRKYLRFRSDQHFMNISGVRREILGERLLRTTGAKVLYGHFKGMKLVSTSWSARDVGSIILGEYERNVLDCIVTSPEKFSVFVDVGAADGIYAVGLAVNGRFKSIFCFESSEASQTSIQLNANANQVESSITILGTAELNFLTVLSVDHEVDLSKAIFLIDIEGGEYDLLSQDNLIMLKHSMVMVEIHDVVEDFRAKYESLLARASNYFTLTTISNFAKSNLDFAELSTWPDEDRQIIFSEGRRNQMSWLVLTPKNLS